MYKLDNVGWTGDRRQHLFLVRADASEAPRQLTTGDFEHSSPAWSPDGQRLAFISARDDDWDLKLATDVYVLDIEDEEAPRKLTSSDGECDLVVWSPDGSRLAFLYTPGTLDWPRHGQVAVIETEGGGPRLLTTSLDRNCMPYPALRMDLRRRRSSSATSWSLPATTRGATASSTPPRRRHSCRSSIRAARS